MPQVLITDQHPHPFQGTWGFQLSVVQGDVEVTVTLFRSNGPNPGGGCASRCITVQHPPDEPRYLVVTPSGRTQLLTAAQYAPYAASYDAAGESDPAVEGGSGALSATPFSSSSARTVTLQLTQGDEASTSSAAKGTITSAPGQDARVDLTTYNLPGLVP